MTFNKKGGRNKGFSLIELIAVLLLVGVLASVAGLGIVQASKAFIFTKNTTEMGQKNVLPLTRIRRSIANLTLITAAGANSITLDRLSNGENITETYAWSGTVDTPLTLTVTDSSGSSGPHDLVDVVQSFTLDFQTQSGGAGSWSVGGLISELAYVTVNLTLAGGDGSQTMQFSDRVVPRNTFIPSTGAPGASAGTTSSEFSCFIKSRIYKDGGPAIIDLYREARRKMLEAGTIGGKMVSLYNLISPRLCLLADKIPGLLPFLKVMFLPVTGLLFLTFHFPWAFMAFAVVAWLIFRLVAKKEKKVKALRFIRNTTGAILIGIIITIVIMAVLSAAMVGMFSSSTVGTVSPQISQQAYYLAESGLAYAAQRYHKHDGNDTAFVNDLNLGGSIPLGNDSFALDLDGYWFDNNSSGSSGTITVSPFGSFPDNVTAGLSGYIQIPVSGGTSVERFTNTIWSGANLRFALNGSVSYTAGDVFPAFLASAQTVTASEIGQDPDLANDVLTPTDTAHLAIFPEVNGIINFTDAAGNDQLLVYRLKKDGKLRGLQYPKGVSFSFSGVSVNSNTPVVLGKHAVISSTGIAGTGSLQSTQTVKMHQPLSTVELYKKVEGGIDFNDAGDAGKISSKLGTHAIEGGALKVTSTEQTYSYTNYTQDGHTGPVLHSESLAVVNWDHHSFETNFLKQLWEKSGNKLTYDLQAKVKFTETEDDTDSAPINHPGCYMPGLSFRIRSPKAGNFGQATYYGLSFLRGLQGLEEHEESSGSCGGSSYSFTENDDITDNFFNDHSDTTNASEIQACPDSAFTPTNWNDDPPLDGIPYIMLWQKDVSTNAAGDAVNTGGCGGGADYSPWEWLAYSPLVDAARVRIYHYKIGSTHFFYEGANSDAGIAPFYVNEYWSWKLKDRYNILSTTTLEGVEILGSPGPSNVIIRDPANYVHNAVDPANPTDPGDPVNTFDGTTTCPVGFIRVPTISNEERKSDYNYKIYIKPWATILVRVYEMEGNLDCDTGTGDAEGNERVNAITAFITDPDGKAGTLGYPKDDVRDAVPRDTIKWTYEGDYFSQIVWTGLRNSGGPVFDGETGYTSHTVQNPEASGCGSASADIKLVEKGKDNEGDNVIVYTGTYTTADYFQLANTYDVSEFGLHTLGINGESTDPDNQEVAYFDDFYWLLWEGGQSSLFPGVREQ